MVPEDPQAPVLPVLMGFGRALRDAGVRVGAGQLITCADGVAALDPTDPTDVYCAGRSCLISRHEDLATYDAVFRHYFGAWRRSVEAIGVGLLDDASATSVHDAEDHRKRDADRRGDGAETAGLIASSREVLRHKRFTECTPDELAELRALMARMRLVPPPRRTRRRAASHCRDSFDLRRTVRRSLRSQGEPLRRAWRTRRFRPRPVVMLLDISGSMAASSRALLQFAHSAARLCDVEVEVFCFATRLTRITRELRHRRPDDALAGAADAVVEWGGGTRIGDALRTFVRTWGRRAIGRGAVVIICSDGLERGDPAELGAQMAALARLAG
ncbi:VWA domain-containing protein [soil metagenome]